MAPAMRSALTPTVRGLDNLDGYRDRPLLFVANHSSHVDTPMLLCALPSAMRSRTAVTAAADYFFESYWRGLSTAFLFGTVPIERRGGAPSTAPLDLLRDGWNLVIYPEGTRSATGSMGRFRLGAAHLSIMSGVPVVPVGIRGSYAAMPRGRAWPVAGKPAVSLRFGRPMFATPPTPPASSDSPASFAGPSSVVSAAGAVSAAGGTSERAERQRLAEEVRGFTARITAEVTRLLAEDATTWWESLQLPETTAAPTHRAPATARWRQVWDATEPVAAPGPPSVWGRSRKN
jgi:1-acyl-sn-glycerol-3-phosphate acyltransferase